MKTLSVRQVMTVNPTMAELGMLVSDGAALMLKKGVGSLVVVDGDTLVGMLTERDILRKVVAQNKNPNDAMVKDVMTTPVITIDPDMDITEAARKMVDLNVRRLPVVKDGRLLGLVTEKDILHYYPEMVEITREWATTGEPRFRDSLYGRCEDCGVFTDRLRLVNGRHVCDDCFESYQ